MFTRCHLSKRNAPEHISLSSLLTHCVDVRSLVRPLYIKAQAPTLLHTSILVPSGLVPFHKASTSLLRIFRAHNYLSVASEVSSVSVRTNALPATALCLQPRRTSLTRGYTGCHRHVWFDEMVNPCCPCTTRSRLSDPEAKGYGDVQIP